MQDKEAICYNNYKNIVYKYSLYRNENYPLSKDLNLMFIENTSLDYEKAYDEFGNDYFYFYCDDGTLIHITEIDSILRFDDVVEYWNDVIEEYDFELNIKEYEKENHLIRDYELVSINNSYYYYKNIKNNTNYKEGIYNQLTVVLEKMNNNQKDINIEFTVDSKKRMNDYPSIHYGNERMIVKDSELSLLNYDLFYYICDNVPKDRYLMYCEFKSNKDTKVAVSKLIYDIAIKEGIVLEHDKEDVVVDIANSKINALRNCNNYREFYFATEYIIIKLENYILEFLERCHD